MPQQHPPHLAEALARFRAAAGAAVEQGRRAAEDARGTGAAFDRETRTLASPPRRHHSKHRAEPDSESETTVLEPAMPEPAGLEPNPEPPEPTGEGLRAAAEDYRRARGLPLWDEPPARTPRRPPDDEDFSQFRIMRPLL